MFVLVGWADSGKKETWSGTPSGLLCGLQNSVNCPKLINVINYKNFVLNPLLKIVKLFSKLFSIDDCGLFDCKLETMFANACIDRKSMPVIAFDENHSKFIEDTYLFLDCSVDFAYRVFLKKDSIISKFVPLNKDRSFSLISRRWKYANYAYDRCKGIFTMGQWAADELVEKGGLSAKKVHCVGGGVNVDQNLVNVRRKNGRRFLFVGKDFERKNGPLVVEAFAKLNAEHGNEYELYIAGPREWPLSGEIPSNIHFLGLKTSDELVEFYNLCDVFVMPSIFEAYGLVFAEALVFGLPVIGRDAFAMKDFVRPGDNGYLLKTNSVEELARLMYSAISDEEMRGRVISRREEYVARYSWDAVARRIINVMRDDGYEV